MTTRSPAAVRLRNAMTTRSPAAVRLRNAMTSRSPAAVRLRNTMTTRSPAAVRLRNAMTSQSPAAVRLRNTMTSQSPAPVRLRNAMTTRSPAPVRLRNTMTTRSPAAVRLRNAMTTLQVKSSSSCSDGASRLQSAAAFAALWDSLGTVGDDAWMGGGEPLRQPVFLPRPNLRNNDNNEPAPEAEPDVSFLIGLYPISARAVLEMSDGNVTVNRAVNDPTEEPDVEVEESAGGAVSPSVDSADDENIPGSNTAQSRNGRCPVHLFTVAHEPRAEGPRAAAPAAGPESHSRGMKTAKRPNQFCVFWRQIFARSPGPNSIEFRSRPDPLLHGLLVF
ncbi:hypothetical protein WMY93_007473 [Mugilogobius chulae]|uniref:Uncharacterized protein n=1 Tax=Mugilogobius chulae TaxID=88201 RepID=A0AAW0PGH4_9GOBI